MRQHRDGQPDDHGRRHDGAGGERAGGNAEPAMLRRGGGGGLGGDRQRAGQLHRERRGESQLRAAGGQLQPDGDGDVHGERRVRQRGQRDQDLHGERHDGAGGERAGGNAEFAMLRRGGGGGLGGDRQRAGQLHRERRGESQLHAAGGQLQPDGDGDVHGERRVRQRGHGDRDLHGERHDGAGGERAGGNTEFAMLRRGGGGGLGGDRQRAGKLHRERPRGAPP